LFKNKYLQESEDGLILYAHGSRNTSWRKPFDRLVRDLKKRGHTQTVLAFGEFMSPSVAEAAQMLAAKGVQQAVIVPLFLGGGLHVRGDLPRLAAEARAASGLKLRVARAICDDAAVLAAIADYCLTQVSDTAKNLRAGRRRAGGKP
jgi:sirohydrochlorin cobaltochelatase